jgi:hypothetical protein
MDVSALEVATGLDAPEDGEYPDDSAWLVDRWQPETNPSEELEEVLHWVMGWGWSFLPAGCGMKLTGGKSMWYGGARSEGGAEPAGMSPAISDKALDDGIELKDVCDD